MSEITKEEILAFTEANTKTALELSRIADALTKASENQEKIVARLYNGMAKEIAMEMVKQFNEHCNPCASTMKEVQKDTSHIKTLFTTFVALVALAMIVTQTVHWIGSYEVKEKSHVSDAR